MESITAKRAEHFLSELAERMGVPPGEGAAHFENGIEIGLRLALALPEYAQAIVAAIEERAPWPGDSIFRELAERYPIRQ